MAEETGYSIFMLFDMGAEDNLIKDFEKDIRTCLDVEKQIKREEREKEWELE